MLTITAFIVLCIDQNSVQRVKLGMLPRAVV